MSTFQYKRIPRIGSIILPPSPSVYYPLYSPPLCSPTPHPCLSFPSDALACVLCSVSSSLHSFFLFLFFHLDFTSSWFDSSLLFLSLRYIVSSLFLLPVSTSTKLSISFYTAHHLPNSNLLP